MHKDSPAVYGALATGNETDRLGAAPTWGRICLRLKKAALRDRVTCTNGDSFDYTPGEMSHHRYTYEDALWAKTAAILLPEQAKEYIECQILGGVIVEEIEAIVVSALYRREVDRIMVNFPHINVEYVDPS